MEVWPYLTDCECQLLPGKLWSRTAECCLLWDKAVMGSDSELRCQPGLLWKETESIMLNTCWNYPQINLALHHRSSSLQTQKTHKTCKRLRARLNRLFLKRHFANFALKTAPRVFSVVLTQLWLKPCCNQTRLAATLPTSTFTQITCQVIYF